MKRIDIIFKNGQVYTGVSKNNTAAVDVDIVDTVAVTDNLITYTGTFDGIKDAITNETKVIDLNGKTMFPGFIDAHAHPILGAFFLSGIRLDVDMELKDILEEIKSYITANPHKSSYFGQGYPEWIFDERGPSKELLDDICPDKPIVLVGSSGHEGWCNSKAFEMAEMDADYPDPIPGFHYLQRDADNQPTGHFVEMGCLYRIGEKIKLFDEEKIKIDIKNIFDYFSTLGITSVADSGMMDYMEDIGMPLIKEMALSGELKLRMFGCCFVSTLEEAEGAISHLKKLDREYCVNDHLQIKTLKIINDGTLESRSASLVAPYDEDESIVEPMLSLDELKALSKEAAENGYDIYIHALGDKAIHHTLDMAETLRSQGYQDTRITNAHTELVLEEDIERFAENNVIANTTGSWHYGNNDMNHIIGERAKRLFPLKSIITSGGKMSLGSDFPVDELGPEPMKAIEIGVTRQMYGQRNAQILPPVTERLTVANMIDGYTVNAAYQIRMQDKIGTIEEGMYADLVVFDKDPYEIDEYDIHRIEVMMTICDGKIVYEK